MLSNCHVEPAPTVRALNGKRLDIIASVMTKYVQKDKIARGRTICPCRLQFDGHIDGVATWRMLWKRHQWRLLLVAVISGFDSQHEVFY